MASHFQIGEISRFFDVPASTLRYWEDVGVLNPLKDRENHYREYTIEDLMTISDVIFYKNLGLSLKQIRGMESAAPEQHSRLFAEKLSYIDNPYLYSRVQHSDYPEKEHRGLTIPSDLQEQFSDSQILWKKQSNRYIAFLMKEEIADGFPNDLQEHLLHIRSGHKTGAMISRFLLCAQENGKVYDFYKTFVEILC